MISDLIAALRNWRRKKCSHACAAQCYSARHRKTRFNTVGHLTAEEEQRLYAAALRGEWAAI